MHFLPYMSLLSWMTSSVRFVIWFNLGYCKLYLCLQMGVALKGKKSSSTYNLIPNVPRDILNKWSPGLLCLTGYVACIDTIQVWSHFPVPRLKIGTSYIEDHLIQQTGIIIRQHQYSHLIVLPNSKFSD